MTSVPPFVKTIPEIVREHSWFVQMLGRQSEPEKVVFFFGLQHPPENAGVSDLLLLKGLGIRFMTLAYEGVNEYGGGFAASDEPLSDQGRKLIEAMAETGIVLDLSHAGHRTARDAIRFIREASSEVRVVATHTACFDLYDHGRGLPDDVLRSISDLGGLIGLVTITWMLDAEDDSIRSLHPRHGQAAESAETPIGVHRGAQRGTAFGYGLFFIQGTVIRKLFVFVDKNRVIH